jgi:hypothetical protein
MGTSAGGGLAPLLRNVPWEHLQLVKMDLRTMK